jgi:3-dehydroquinate synthase
MPTYLVETPQRCYSAIVERGVIGQAAAYIPPKTGKVFVVTTADVWKHAGAPLRAALASVPYEVLNLPGGEDQKRLAPVEQLAEEMVQRGADRSSMVIAFGGGIVTDMGGFLAAIFMRGIPVLQIPTTLLAQVDAAIGGKTAVNIPEGKNLVGAFWQPRGVICDTETLGSLPEREWACGRGEMAKYAFLSEATDESILDLDLEEQIARCVALKAEVVAQDEREGDRRMLLNYGHTLAHALEALGLADDAAGTGLRHGEAVAIGLVYAALVARELGRIDDERVARHRAVVQAFGLSDQLPPGADTAALIGFMARDKKARHDLTFVLDGPSGVEVVHGVPEAAAVAALRELSAVGSRP